MIKVIKINYLVWSLVVWRRSEDGVFSDFICVDVSFIFRVVLFYFIFAFIFFRGIVYGLVFLVLGEILVMLV